jgi:ABC-type arginine/histidine transport system permease subunit
LLAIFSIFIWFFTGTPLYSVILISIVEGLGFIPTIIKTIKDYKTEDITFWALNAFVCVCLLLSLNSFNFVSSVFFLTLLIGNTTMVSIILFFKFKNR